MLSNYGMGSVMYNYYRKTNDEDEDLPKVRIARQCRQHLANLRCSGIISKILDK